MSNKSDGTAFENRFTQLLAEHGFWAHRMQDNRNGQPFDVIAARNGRTYVFDCKVCNRGFFNLSRIEANQQSAMRFWQECGNREGLFVLQLPDSSIRMLSYSWAMYLIDSGWSRLRGGALKQNTVGFEEWLRIEEQPEQEEWLE